MALQPPVRIQDRGVADRVGYGYREGGGYGAHQWLVDRAEEEGSTGRMEEDTELEEGEAFERGGSGSGSGSGDDSEFGIEHLSYLDTRLESVLGDCQREFQGNLSTERLGSRYGGYGTFLPTHVRAAPVLGSGLQPGVVETQRPVQGSGPRPPDGHVGALRPKVPPEGTLERARRGQGSTSASASEVKEYEPKERKKNLRSLNSITNGGGSAMMGSKNNVKDSGPVEKKGLTLKLTLPKAGQGLDKQAQNSLYNKFGLDHPSSPSDEDGEESASEDNATPDRSPAGMIRAMMTGFQDLNGGMHSPTIPPLPPLIEAPEKKEIFKQLMNTPSSKPDGLQGSKKVGVRETLNNVIRTKHNKDLVLAPTPDSVKVGRKEVVEKKEGVPSTLKVSYKHPVREDPPLQSKPQPELKRKGKESSKEYSVPKEPKEKARDAKEFIKDVRKDSDSKDFTPRIAADSGREGPKESFKVTMRDLPPAKDHVKQREHNLENLKDFVKEKGKKSSKKAGKDVTRLHGKDLQRDKGLYRDPVPVSGDVNVLQAPAPQALFPPAEGTSNLDPSGLMAPPLVVLENWVECVKCGQWRLCVPGVNVAELPENWQCREMTWLPGLNSCKHPEETTTAAVYSYLGLQNPNQLQNGGLAGGLAPAPVLPPAIASGEALIESRHLDPKPSKTHRPGSKKGVAKKVGGSTPKIPTPTGKKLDMGSTKRKNINDVVKDDRGLDRGTPIPTEDAGYQRVMAEKQKLKEKEKEKLKRMRANEGEDLRPQKQAREDDRNRASVGSKRKKKSEISPDNEELQTIKKAKGVDVKGRKTGPEMQSKVQSSDENTHSLHSLHYGSDDAGISSRSAACRATLPGQVPRKVKVTSSGSKDPKKIVDRQDARVDDRKRKEPQKAPDMKCKTDFFDKEDSDSDEDKHRRGDYRRGARDSEIHRKGDTRSRNGYTDVNKRFKGEGESGYHNEKRRTVGKHLEETTDFDTGSSPRSRDGVEDGRRTDEEFRGKRLFDEVSGIALTYAQGSFGDSPHGQSPRPNVDPYSQAAPQQEKRGGGSISRSPPTASSSKNSFSAASSASGSKGPSPIESTVSSSPVRSPKVETGGGGGRRVADSIPTKEHMTTADSHHLASKQSPLSPSPKRSVDEPDTQSDRDVQQGQVHLEWDEREMNSPEAERDVRGSVREGQNKRDLSRDRYARSNSREGPADFRKYEGKGRGSGRDDDRHWEECKSRERRADSASHYGNGERDGSYERHRDDRQRERDDSRYDRRTDERYRERERERERERDRDKERPRETWTSDRVDVREDRSIRERSIHQRDDWGGRPSSRESRLDKQSGMGWREDSRPGRDSSRDGRDRIEEEVTEKNHFDRISKPVEENSKDELPCHDEHEPVQCVPDRNGDRTGAGSSLRKDMDVAAPRGGVEPFGASNGGNNRSRLDGISGARNRGSPAIDTRHLENIPKQAKEPKHCPEGSVPVRVDGELGFGSSTGHIARVNDGDPPTFTKKEHAAQASTLTREAKSLKHSADRIKNKPAANEKESTKLYLLAALKFLEGAHHQEAANERPGDLSYQKIYLDTASLCDFCSSTFERHKDHGAAALSHMVAAHARQRVLTLQSKEISKDTMDLTHAMKASAAPGNHIAAVQTPPISLTSVPQAARGPDKPGSSNAGGPIIGESPSSSSASDVDNLNNHVAPNEKGLALNAAKGTAVSPLPGSSTGINEVLPPRIHTSYQRLLSNIAEVPRMLDGLTKARIATAAYEAEFARDLTRQASIVDLRRVAEVGLLDDMATLVKQVRLALHGMDGEN